MIERLKQLRAEFVQRDDDDAIQITISELGKLLAVVEAAKLVPKLSFGTDKLVEALAVLEEK